MLRSAVFAAAIFIVGSPALADTVFTVANTFQDPKMTGGKEISTIAFNPAVYANQAATVGSGVEIANFVSFYEIDVAADMSALTMTVSPTAMPAANPMPKDRFDRYYYSFAGAKPAKVSIDQGLSTKAIAQGAKAEITTTGRLLISFGEGADFTHGNKLVVKLD